MVYIGVKLMYIIQYTILLHLFFFMVDNLNRDNSFYPLFVTGLFLGLYFLVPIVIVDTLVTEDFNTNYNGILDIQIYYILITLCMMTRGWFKGDSDSVWFNKKKILSIISIIFSRKIVVIFVLFMLFSYLTITIFNFMGFYFIYDSKIGLILTVLTLFSITTPLIQIVLLHFNFIYRKKKDYIPNISINPLHIFFSAAMCNCVQLHIIPLVNEIYLHLISYDYNLFIYYILKYIALLFEFVGKISPLKVFSGMGKSLSRYVYNLLLDKPHVTKVTYVTFKYISPIKAFHNAKATHKYFFDAIPKIPPRDYIICRNDYNGSLYGTANNQNTFDNDYF